jgi:hypothetical protein
MTNTEPGTKITNSAKTDKTDISHLETQKGVEYHKKAAEHFQLAAKHHLEAAHHHEAGAHEKAAESTVAAHGHSLLARENQRKDARHHASKSE